MAATEYGVNHPLAVKKWAKSLMKEALKKTHALQFMGSSSDSVVQIKTELKDVGDKVTFGLRMQLQGDGIKGDNTLEGNEESLVTYSDHVIIDQLRHAVRTSGRMSEQRVPFSVRAESRDGLSDWWADRIDSAFFNQLCGNTAVTDLRYSGMNATVAPDADHHIYANEDSEASLSAGDEFTLSLLDYAVERAETLRVPMRPINIGGKKHYVVFLHPYQVTDLRTNTSPGQWLDIQKAAMMGGKVSDNPIFTGALGVYNGVIIHKSTRIPSVVANTRRAVFCGAQAASIAFGKGYNKGSFEWVEELFDFKNQLGVAAGTIWGLKKNRFNSLDHSTLVISTYAVQHG